MLRTELIRPLPELLNAHAHARGEQLAFADAHRSVTYAELAERTARLAGSLRGYGLERGDRVLIYLDNAVETVESYLAVTRAAAIGVCINPQAAEREAAYMVEHSGAHVIITDHRHLAAARALATQSTSVWLILRTGSSAEPDHGAPAESSSGALPTANKEPSRRAQPQPPAQSTVEVEVHSYEDAATATTQPLARDDLGLDEPAWMLYTSGTTGRPKGVLLSQRSCLWVVAACWAPITGLSARDHVLAPLPLFHSYALDLCVLGVVAVGASERIMGRFSTDEALRLLRSEPVTYFPGVPTMFQYLLEAAGDRGLGADALRACVSAGAIMSATLNREFERAFDVLLLDGYGITETSTMVTMNWPVGARMMGSCGLPLPGSAVRVVDPATGVDVGPGEEGELWVRGPHVMLGYFNQPEETAQALQDGWYHSGDLGHYDEHGLLTISGRVKELIIRGGENVYPAEVEEVLLDDSDVLDAAVVGKSDDRLGEVPIAFVVPQKETTIDEQALLDRCRDALSEFKVPTQIRLAETIPRTGSGKVMRHRLQSLL